MTTNSNKPVLTLRDGGIKASIWFKATEKGDFHNVQITRTWRDADGNYHNSTSFSGTELLRVALLATQAYEHFSSLKLPDATE